MRGRVKELYLRRFPHLEDFISGPACAMINVAAGKYILVERFREVMELEVDGYAFWCPPVLKAGMGKLQLLQITP